MTRTHSDRDYPKLPNACVDIGIAFTAKPGSHIQSAAMDALGLLGLIDGGNAVLIFNGCVMRLSRTMTSLDVANDYNQKLSQKP